MKKPFFREGFQKIYEVFAKNTAYKRKLLLTFP
jgi:hypothetical protein